MGGNNSSYYQPNLSSVLPLRRRSLLPPLIDRPNFKHVMSSHRIITSNPTIRRSLSLWSSDVTEMLYTTSSADLHYREVGEYQSGTRNR